MFNQFVSTLHLSFIVYFISSLTLDLTVRVCMVRTFSRARINPACLRILLVISCKGMLYIFSCPCSCPNTLPRQVSSAVPSRVNPLILNIWVKSGIPVPIPPAFHGGVYTCTDKYLSESVPSLSGHAITYRWFSPPRASGGTWQIVLKAARVTGVAYSGNTMDQFLRAYIFLQYRRRLLENKTRIAILNNKQRTTGRYDRCNSLYRSSRQVCCKFPKFLLNGNPWNLDDSHLDFMQIFAWMQQCAPARTGGNKAPGLPSPQSRHFMKSTYRVCTISRGA